MNRILYMLGSGVVAYIVANQVIRLLITGTSTSDTIIIALTPLGIAVAIVVGALLTIVRKEP